MLIDIYANIIPVTVIKSDNILRMIIKVKKFKKDKRYLISGIARISYNADKPIKNERKYIPQAKEHPHPHESPTSV